ncbi:MAG: AAA family ATPase [Sulfuricurvum sp.]
MKKIDDSQFIWSEKYRPQTLDDVIIDEKTRSKFKEFIKDERFPHILLSSTNPGVGKTSIVHSIIKDLNADVKWINGSQDRGIDTFKVSVKEFITSVSIDDSPKIVVIDECLEENERIKTKDGSIRLKDMQIGAIYDCLSVNKNTLKVEEDTCEVISTKEAEVFEIEMTDGRTITLTADHPVMVKTSTGVIKKSISEGLNEDDEIVDFLELKTEENQDCGVEVTVKFSTEHAKILEDSNINKEHLLRGFLDVIIAEQTKKQTKKADEKAA